MNTNQELEEFEKWMKEECIAFDSVTLSDRAWARSAWMARAALSVAPSLPDQGERFIRKSDGSIVFLAHKDMEAYGEWLKKGESATPIPPAPNDEEELVYELWDSKKGNYTTISKGEYQCHLGAGKEVRVTRLTPSEPSDELRNAADDLITWWDNPKESTIGCYPGLYEKFESLRRARLDRK